MWLIRKIRNQRKKIPILWCRPPVLEVVRKKKMAGATGLEPATRIEEAADCQKDTVGVDVNVARIDSQDEGELCREVARVVASWAGLSRSARQRILAIAREPHSNTNVPS